MSDDTTEALNRIANALELQALVAARDSYCATFHRLVDGSGGLAPKQMNKIARRIDDVDSRIDQITGYTEEDA
ncbi:hypothetical protein [uncultured Stenotrophomonas sp.]|uniref:hypothetical protein n=1 Tax=uncultured Stenotrophomonas sp. TaxID=165438 RepID=UPI0025CE2646|nr:hypothetical protein [uncultured Stenotrophomonas sp.]